MQDNHQSVAGSDLQEAINDLYRVFRSYLSRPHTGGCPCCVSKAESQRLGKSDLRGITPKELERFAYKAMTTWGTVGDFRRLLPRLFEIEAEEPGSHWDTEVLFGKLSYGEWLKWPELEQQTVRHFMDAYWDSRLSTEPTYHGIEELLCGVGLTGMPLSPLLHRWREPFSHHGLGHLAGLIWDNHSRLLTEKSLGNGFWSDCPSAMEEVVHWLFDPATAEAFEQAWMSEDLNTLDPLKLEITQDFFSHAQTEREVSV